MELLTLQKEFQLDHDSEGCQAYKWPGEPTTACEQGPLKRERIEQFPDIEAKQSTDELGEDSCQRVSF